ncbi:MAG: hypothetical protein IAF38_05390 [Bacteroidia bacterium]|nr:hypothetical protein [Bacteroidia bacterium]
MKKLLLIFFVFSLFGKIFSQNDSIVKNNESEEKKTLKDSLKKNKLVMNGFIGGGFGWYKSSRTQFSQSFPMSFLLNGTFKIHYGPATVLAFSQIMHLKGSYNYFANVNSNGLLFGPGFYRENFSCAFGVGFGAMHSREYFTGGAFSASHINAASSSRIYESAGWSSGFYMAFKGPQYARFSMQCNIVRTRATGFTGLVILGFELGKQQLFSRNGSVSKKDTSAIYKTNNPKKMNSGFSLFLGGGTGGDRYARGGSWGIAPNYHYKWNSFTMFYYMATKKGNDSYGNYNVTRINSSGFLYGPGLFRPKFFLSVGVGGGFFTRYSSYLALNGQSAVAKGSSASLCFGLMTGVGGKRVKFSIAGFYCNRGPFYSYATYSVLAGLSLRLYSPK